MTKRKGDKPKTGKGKVEPRGLKKHIRRLERQLETAAQLERKRLRKLDKAQRRRRRLEASLGQMKAAVRKPAAPDKRKRGNAATADATPIASATPAAKTAPAAGARSAGGTPGTARRPSTRMPKANPSGGPASSTAKPDAGDKSIEPA